MAKRLLATFIAEEIKEKFDIYGDYEIEKGKEFDFFSDSPNLMEFNFPEFYDVTIDIYKKDEKQNYIPTGESWSGHKYEASDIMEFVVAALIRGDKTYTKIYLEEGLENLINSYTSDIAITVEENPVPKRILTKDMRHLFQLMMVTNDYIYYGCEESMFMLTTQEHTVVSDNYFAEVGYFDSVENIEKGEETLLWGKLPEEY